MANTDEQGNKIAEKKINDKAKGKQERMVAANKAKETHGLCSWHCPYCGYRVRTTGHFQGTHHKN